MATLDEALAIALDLHTAGRTEEAETLYGRILDAVPDEPNALHLYGLLCAQSGRLEQAAGLLVKAVALRPGLAEYRANLAMLHQARGNPAAAADEYRAALALCPDSAALAFPLAGTARQAGDGGLAMAAYRRTTLIQPDLAEPLAQAGILLRREGRTEEAVAALRRAVRLRPDHGEAWHHLGVALQRLKEPEAVAALDHAAALLPEDATVRLNLGRARFEADRRDSAVLALRSALALDPANDGALELLAAALRDAGREGEAVTVLRRFLRLRPDSPNGWHALSLSEPGALRSLQRALALRPDHRNALGALANRLRDRREVAASLRLHDRAVGLQPANAEARWNRSLTRLLAGDLPGGWEDYEARWGVADFPTKPRGLPQPLWSGQDITGQTILLHEEQGRGDAIQFVRYAPLVAARGARVLLEVGADLVSLFRSLPGVERVVARGEPLPAFDWQCPLLSLPRAFGTRLESIPSAPYLSAGPARAAAWRDRLAGDGLRVGLVWAGNPHFAGDRERSPGLAALAPLLDVPGCRFFGLQLGPGHDELARRAMPPSFTDLAPEIRDFADTAAVMASLDLVVSSCTAPAHLAGALGVPLWVLLSHVPDWRWLLDRPDSPWYPSARLFRQPRPGDWAAVAAEAAAALTARVAVHS
ncbi:tetratricopeptide repeat protein [Roseomonas genomospecies 6]|uniref:Tetratricopeptide repeat protein n=1 Tax=Roseomonas genomospecies 6 TaxID=214106 RepID=A0A9W7NNV2_9PROT|nr:tetratricopeptide repeat protein [Roseomonas genomospecies 6]KAA0684098.1 tetratricopeptide repeat protein [Roseomonas genomospecies 6]